MLKVQQKAERSFSARAACAQVPPITNPGPKTADCTPVLAAAFSKFMSCFQHFMELPPLTTHVCPAQRSRCGYEVAVCLVGMQLPQVHQSSVCLFMRPASWPSQSDCLRLLYSLLLGASGSVQSEQCRYTFACCCRSYVSLEIPICPLFARPALDQLAFQLRREVARLRSLALFMPQLSLDFLFFQISRTDGKEVDTCSMW